MNPAKEFGLVQPIIESVSEVQSVLGVPLGGVEAAWRNGRRFPLKKNEIVELQLAREDCRKGKTTRVPGAQPILGFRTNRQIISLPR
jgi:hypothetical protein